MRKGYTGKKKIIVHKRFAGDNLSGKTQFILSLLRLRVVPIFPQGY